MTEKPEKKAVTRKRPHRLQLYHAQQNPAHLQKRFENGEMLAPFECCAVWQREGLPSKTLPEWVTDHLQSVAASYFDTGPRYRNGRRVVPRRLIEMTREQRDAVLPSLDKTARLLGGRGKPGAWLWRAEYDRDGTVQAYLDHFMERRGERPFIQLQSGKKVPVFVEQGPYKGRFRSEALNRIAHRFHVKGQDRTDRAKTMRRRFQLD